MPIDPTAQFALCKYALLLLLVLTLRRRQAYSVLLVLAFLWPDARLLNAMELEPLPQQWDRLAEKANTAEERWSVFIDAGDWCFDNDRQSDAYAYFAKALETAEQHFERYDVRLANTLLKLGALEEDRLKARTLFNRALEIQEHTLGNAHPDLAATLEALVWTYDYEEGDSFEIAVDLLKRAVEYRRKGVTQEGVSETLRVLAWLYNARGQQELATRYYEEALAQDEHNYGSDDLRSLLAMENLAAFYLDQGLYAKAQELLLRKLQLHLEGGIEAQDSYNLSRTESMLGWVRLRQDDYKNAETYFLQAFNHLNLAIGSEDSTLHIPALLDLVYLYAVQQNYEQAKPYFRRAQEILKHDGEGIEAHARELEEAIKIPKTAQSQMLWPTEAQALGIRLMLKYVGLIDN